MSEVKLDNELFSARSKRIYEKLRRPLLIMLGKSSDVEQFNLNSSLFLYLLKYEFPDTLLIISDKCTAITSKKKAELFMQIPSIDIVIKNKDNSNINEIYSLLKDTYCVAGVAKGVLCNDVLQHIKTVDVSNEIEELLLVKDNYEIELCKTAGVVANHLCSKSIDLIRDDQFSVGVLEDELTMPMKSVDISLVELSYKPISSRQHIKLGVRYNGYCVEIGRTIIKEMTAEYEAQDYILSLIKPGKNSKDILSDAEKYCNKNSLNVHLYTAGLMQKERNFSKEFRFDQNIIFVIEIFTEYSVLCNTFVMKTQPIFLTREDKPSDFVDARPKFRNKERVHEMSLKRADHQKYLLDKLIEQQLRYYKSGNVTSIEVEKNKEKVVTYQKEGLIPRHGRLEVDVNNCSVLIPIGAYLVPFHISTIKTVSVADDMFLRFKFNVDLERKNCSSFLKSINIKCSNARELSERIGCLKKDYTESKKMVGSIAQDALKEKFKKVTLFGVSMRTDSKIGTRKRKAGNLEIHENGFRFTEDKIDILFSNIRHVFFQEGNVENRTLLHFHLYGPVIVNEKTVNVQFYKEAGSNTTYDTQKRGDEQMEYILEQEEEDRQRAINKDFKSFADAIEKDTPLKVQIPGRGFFGVPFKEPVVIRESHECLVSLLELPFFVLTLEDIEIVNFERVIYVTKTSDVVFIKKDKSQLPVSIFSIDSDKINYLKEFLDSNNIVFMETSVNIQWNNLLKDIMKDPISFYESGAWAELIVNDHESEQSEESEVSEVSEYTSDSLSDDSEGSAISSVSSTLSESESEVGDSEDVMSEDYETEEESDYDYEDRPKRGKKNQ